MIPVGNQVLPKDKNQGQGGLITVLDTALIGTRREIYFLAAFAAFMGFAEFIGKNFLFSLAFRAFAGKGF